MRITEFEPVDEISVYGSCAMQPVRCKMHDARLRRTGRRAEADCGENMVAGTHSCLFCNEIRVLALW